MIPIVPAVIPKSQDQIKSLLDKLSFSTEVHIDVVDGKFVPFLSWPYEPKGKPTDIKDLTDHFTLEVDLMVEAPLSAAEDWLASGADMLVFHTESISLSDFRNFVHSAPASIGISALNDTSLDILLPYIELADYVQVMGIAKIGAQGQPFDVRGLERIASIKNIFPNKLISVDGSVNFETIASLRQVGIGRLIVGSAIVSAIEPYEAYLELNKLIN